MPRPRTGSAYVKAGKILLAVRTWRPGALKTKWTEVRADLDATNPEHLAGARQAARLLQQRYDAEPPTWDPWAPTPTAETFARYAERWLKDRRERRGLRSVHDDESRLEHWVTPTLGARPVDAITRDEVEALRDALDTHVREEHLSWKTAENIWSVVARLFRDAAGSKLRALRVRADNPAAGVQPPDKGRARAKSFLYPSEAAALAARASNPGEDLDELALFVVNAYTGLRIGELAALDLADIDLAHDDIHVHRAYDAKAKVIRETKTEAGNRHVPIEPAIKPVIAALVARRGGTGLLFPAVPAQRDAAKHLRAMLERAGVTRAALFTSDRTRKNLTVHDLRATAITWWAVRGDDAVKIQRRAGHEDFNTTLGYIREAENRRAGFGSPFPPVPPELLRALGAATGEGAGLAPGMAASTPAPNASAAENTGPEEVPAAGVELSRDPIPADSERNDSTSSAPPLTRATPGEPARPGLATDGAIRVRPAGPVAQLYAAWAAGALWPDDHAALEVPS
jgi:integrase